MMNAGTIVQFLNDNREVAELGLIVIFALSSSVREIIATVSEMMQSAMAADDDAAKRKAIELLKRKLPFLIVIPDFVLGALIEWFFKGIKKRSNKELADIRMWEAKPAG